MLLLQANSRPNVVEVVTYSVDIYYLFSGFSLYDIIPETVLLCEPSAPGYRRFGTESKPFTKPEAIWVRSKNPASTNITQFGFRYRPVQTHLLVPPHHIRTPGQTCTETDQNQ